jgi:predicted O-methyltransferase YrrM
MDLALLRQLDALATFGRDNDARESARAMRMLNITPDTGRLLWILVSAMRAKQILEVGTSNAYSTLWLADAAHGHAGRVTTLEFDASKIALARENLERAGLSETVEIVAGRAVESLARLPGPFDLIFLDADRESYLDYLELALPRLRSGGLLIADNVTSHAHELAAYLATVQTHPQLFAVTLPVGNGEQVALKR